MGDLATISQDGDRLSLLNLAMAYDLNDSYNLRGVYNRGELRDGGDKITLEKLSLGVGYAVSPRTQAFADVAALRGKGGGDTVNGQSITVGVSMDLGAKPAAHQTTSERLRDVFGKINAVSF